MTPGDNKHECNRVDMVRTIWHDASYNRRFRGVERQGQGATRVNIEQIFDLGPASEVACIDDRLPVDLAPGSTIPSEGVETVQATSPSHLIRKPMAPLRSPG